MTEPEEPRDFLADLHEKIPDFRGYDELAADQYIALGHYIALRIEGVPLPQAVARICEVHGHDAPRGKCQRCGLGVELDKEDTDKARRRVAERERWLAQRGN